MDDELFTPNITQPEELFPELREQTTVMLLAEGLLRYTDPSFAFSSPVEEGDIDAGFPAE